MNEGQKSTLENFAKHIKETNPVAIGVAYMLLDCGCIQTGPFDEHGSQAGPIEHFLTKVEDGNIKLCPQCMNDGGPHQRVSESGLLFFDPMQLSDSEKEWIGNKIFC